MRAKSIMKEDKENINEILYFQDLLYISKIIYTKLINWHHNNLLAGYLRIKKTQKLVTQKYYWLTLCHNIKVYIKSYEICLTSKVMKYKPY